MTGTLKTPLFIAVIKIISCLMLLSATCDAVSDDKQKINIKNYAPGLSMVNGVEIIRRLSKENADRLAQSYISSYNLYDSAVSLDNKTITTGSDFHRAIFKQEFSAILTHFSAPESFTLVQFRNKALMPSAEFEEATYFRWTTFNDDVNFSHSHFNKAVDFYSSVFVGERSSFYGARFSGPVSFASAQFRTAVDFTGATIKQNSKFYKTIFSAPVKLQAVDFQGDVDFSYANFQSNVSFAQVKFSRSANFSHARFGAKVSFSNARMPEYLDLSGVNDIAFEIDFTNARPAAFGKKSRVNLIGADIKRLHINYQNFQLDFPPKTSAKEITEVYEGLLNDFKARGLSQGYRSLFIEYERYKFAHNGDIFMDIVQDYWWDYGFKKERIFIWIGVLIILFTLINNLFILWLMENAFEVSFLLPFCQRIPENDGNAVVRYVLNLPLALIYTVVIFFGSLLGFKREFTQFKSHHIMINSYLFVTMAAGLICAMFILNYLVK